MRSKMVPVDSVRQLERGDIVRHRGTGVSYVVNANRNRKGPGDPYGPAGPGTNQSSGAADWRPPVRRTASGVRGASSLSVMLDQIATNPSEWLVMKMTPEPPK